MAFLKFKIESNYRLSNIISYLFRILCALLFVTSGAMLLGNVLTRLLVRGAALLSGHVYQQRRVSMENRTRTSSDLYIARCRWCDTSSGIHNFAWEYFRKSSKR